MIKVLHVDDEKVENDLLVLNVGKISKEFSFIWKSSPSKAFDILEEGGIDVIVSDYQMPGINGLQFLKQLKQRKIDIPFVFYTGQGNEELAIEALREGASDYFIKGQEFAHYERIINRLGRIVKAHRETKKRKRIESVLFDLEGRYLKAASNKEKIKFTDVVDVPKLQEMMDVFYNMTGHPFAIIDLENNIHVATGWQDVCTKFHRVNPDTKKLCFESDKFIEKNLSATKPVVYTCQLGLTDCAIPIIISGRHVATMFTGQFFLEDQPFDEQYFIDQARKYSFDQNSYLAAIKDIPRFSEERVHQMLDFSSKFVKIVSDLGNSNLRFSTELLERKKKDSQLDRLSLHLKKASEVGLIGIWEYDIIKEQLNWSESQCKLFGVPIGTEINYEQFLSLVHPEDKTKLDIDWEHSSAGRKNGVEYRILVDGDIKWISDSYEFEKDESGRITRAIGITQDVTNQKASEKAIVESEASYKSYLKNFFGIAYQGDMNFKQEFFYGAIEEITGYSEEDFTSGRKKWDLVIHPDDVSDIHASAEQIRSEANTVIEREYRIVRKDGSIRWVRENIANISDDAGVPVRVQGTIQDITKYKDAEFKLSASKTWMDNLVRSIPFGLGIVQERKFIEVNDHFCQMTGWERSELLDQHVKMVHLSDQLENQLHSSFEKQLKAKGEASELVQIRVKSGDIRDVQINVSIIGEEIPPKLAFAVVDFTDYEQLKRLLEKEKIEKNFILEGTNAATWQWNVQTGETIYNDKWAEILGYTLEELEPISEQNWYNFAHPDDQKQLNEIIEKHFSGETDMIDSNVRLKHREGHWIVVNVRGKLQTRTSDGQPEWAYGANIDITNQYKVKEHEATFRKIFDINPVVKLLIDPSDGKIVNANKAASEFYGYSLGELKTLNIGDINTLSKGKLREKLDLANTEKLRQFQFKHKLKSGEIRDVVVCSGPITLERKTLLFSIIFDVTEREQLRKQLENEKKGLKEREKRLHALADNLPNGLIFQIESDPQDIQNRFTFVSEGIRKVRNIPAESVLNDSQMVFDQVIEDDRKMLDDLRAKSLKEQKPLSAEFRIKCPDESIKWIWVNAAPRLMDNGRVIWDGVELDITENKRHERELAEERWKLNEILHSTRTGTWEWNIQTNETRFNEEWAGIIGYTLEELSPVSIDTWINSCHPEDLERSNDQIEKLFNGETDYYEIETRMKHKDGRWIWVLDRGNIVSYTEDCKPLMMFGTHQDITMRKMAEQKLKDAQSEILEKNKALESFSYTVSHDLKAPLRRLEAFTNILKDNMQGSPGELDVPELTDRIIDSAKEMNCLVDNILTFSQASNSEIKKNNLNLARLANSTIDLLKESDTSRDVEFKIAKQLTAMGDKNLLLVVISNLLGNAWKYTAMKDKPVIRMGRKKVNGVHAFYVQDNGVGFPQDKAEKVFDPFTRLHVGKEYKGTGIGLATVKRIIERHGGKIWAESKPDKGATFYFTLGE